MTSRVTGSERVAGDGGAMVDAWVVESKIGPQTFRIWIAKDSRDVVQACSRPLRSPLKMMLVALNDPRASEYAQERRPTPHAFLAASTRCSRGHLRARAARHVAAAGARRVAAATLAVYPNGDASRIEYASDDGQPLFAYLVGDPARARGLIIAYHGNADLAAWVVPWAAEVERLTGWAVLVPEYRGYGGLAGSPDYPSSQRDARATFRLARESLGFETSRIALYGHSLGSAIATELAREHAPAVLILEAPFTSARDMARGMLAPVAAMWTVIARVHFDTRAEVAKMGRSDVGRARERDGVVPVRMGRAAMPRRAFRASCCSSAARAQRRQRRRRRCLLDVAAARARSQVKAQPRILTDEHGFFVPASDRSAKSVFIRGNPCDAFGRLRFLSHKS